MPSCESSPSRSRAQEVIARDVRGMRAVYPTCIVEVSPIEPDCLCGRPVVVRCTYTRHAYTLGYDPQPQPQPGRRAVRLVDANARQLSVVGAGDARAQALAPARTDARQEGRACRALGNAAQAVVTPSLTTQNRDQSLKCNKTLLRISVFHVLTLLRAIAR